MSKVEHGISTRAEPDLFSKFGCLFLCGAPYLPLFLLADGYLRGENVE